jgi:hypothetical protein
MNGLTQDDTKLLIDEGRDVFHLARDSAQQNLDGSCKSPQGLPRPLFVFGERRALAKAGPGR